MTLGLAYAGLVVASFALMALLSRLRRDDNPPIDYGDRWIRRGDRISAGTMVAEVACAIGILIVTLFFLGVFK